MGQLGFFELSRRDEGRAAKNDPLAAIAAMVPCESLRPKLKAAPNERRASPERRGTQEFGGTQAMGRSRDLQALVLQARSNLSGDQM